MVVAVITVRMVQVPVNQIIHMISGMTGTLVLWRTGVWVRRRDANHMFIDMVAVRMVHMAIVQVVNMAFMLNSDVPAIGSMLVVVVGVVGLVARCHGDTPVG